MIYITADTHFGHSNIIRYCDRPFSSIGEMDARLIGNINDLVQEDDILIHAGDFAFGDYNKIINYRNRIICKNIYLIAGNHDRYIWQFRHRLANIFTQIVEYIFVKIDETFYLINHYPIKDERKQSKVDTFNKLIKEFNPTILYGHTHKPGIGNIGVDLTDFTPVLLGANLTRM